LYPAISKAQKDNSINEFRLQSQLKRSHRRKHSNSVTGVDARNADVPHYL